MSTYGDSTFELADVTDLTDRVDRGNRCAHQRQRYLKSLDISNIYELRETPEKL